MMNNKPHISPKQNAKKTVVAAASVACVAACRAAVEAGRVETFLGRERDRLSKEAVKREGEVSGLKLY